MCEKFKTYVQPYVFYEHMEEFEDYGFAGKFISAGVREEDY